MVEQKRRGRPPGSKNKPKVGRSPAPASEEAFTLKELQSASQAMEACQTAGRLREAIRLLESIKA